MTKKYYDIHGIISIVVNINQWYIPNNLLDSLEVFKVNSVEDPDITININHDVKKPDDCYIVNHKNYIAYNNVYTEGKYKGLRYQVAYSWLHDNKINLDVCVSFANKLMVFQRYAIPKTYLSNH